MSSYSDTSSIVTRPVVKRHCSVPPSTQFVSSMSSGKGLVSWHPSPSDFNTLAIRTRRPQRRIRRISTIFAPSYAELVMSRHEGRLSTIKETLLAELVINDTYLDGVRQLRQAARESSSCSTLFWTEVDIVELCQTELFILNAIGDGLRLVPQHVRRKSRYATLLEMIFDIF